MPRRAQGGGCRMTDRDKPLGPKWRVLRGFRLMASLYAESAKAACEKYAAEYAEGAGMTRDARMYHAVRCQ